MRIYPAIDIRGGKCVRLRQGIFADMTIYNDDPADISKVGLNKLMDLGIVDTYELY